MTNHDKKVLRNLLKTTPTDTLFTPRFLIDIGLDEKSWAYIHNTERWLKFWIEGVFKCNGDGDDFEKYEGLVLKSVDDTVRWVMSPDGYMLQIGLDGKWEVRYSEKLKNRGFDFHG